MSSRDYLLDLIARGVPAAQAAQAVGCTDGYVSQLLKDPEFLQQVESLRATRLQDKLLREERSGRIHDMYQDLEEQVLTDLKRNVMLLRTHEKVRLLGTLAQKKPPTPTLHTPNEGAGAAGIGVVHIHLPAVAAAQFVMDGNMDIIGLEQNGTAQELLPMPTQQLKRLAAERKEHRAQIVDGGAIKNMFDLNEEIDDSQIAA